MAKKKIPNPAVPATPTSAADALCDPVRARNLLVVILGIYLALAIGYNVLTPTNGAHNPDEGAHWLYVQTVAAGHLPVFSAASPDYEAHQPPLYYLLCAPVYVATHSVHAVRAVSTLMGGLLIVAAYGCVLTLFPEAPLLAVGTAAFVAFLPMNVAQSASVTNDALTNLLMAVGLWRLAKMASTRETDGRHAIGLGLILAAGLWTKTSTLLLFPTVVLALYLLARSQVIPATQALRTGVIALSVGVALAAPWLIRNQLLYGDPVAQHIFVSAFQNTATTDKLLPALGLGRYFSAVTQWTFASFWGGFDSMSVFWGQDPHQRSQAFYFTGSPGTLYQALALLSGLALIGLGVLPRAQRLTPAQKALVATFTVLTALTGLVFLRFILTFFQAQGRYWYPALVPLALFFVLGWRGLLPQPGRFRVFVAVLSLGLLLLNLDTLFGILHPRFTGL